LSVWKFLSSKGILDYSVLLDKEGEAGAESKTLIAAKEASLKNCEEADSIDHFGIRMADMLVGIIGKLMKSLYHSLTPTQDSPALRRLFLARMVQTNRWAVTAIQAALSYRVRDQQ
jgi:hypothetical protein